MTLRNCLSTALGIAALAWMAMPPIAVAEDPAPAAACADGSCSAGCSCKKEREEATRVTIDLQQRCYTSKCETIRFPCSPILPNLFHGWKHTPQCSDGNCQCPAPEPSCAKCGCEYLHKTLIVKIRHTDQPINICPTCGENGGGFTVNYGAQPARPQPAPAPEMVPAPRPAGAVPAPMPK